MEENSKGKIVPPSKRKLMLIKKIEELRDGGYKLRSQKNFSVVLARKSQEKDKDFLTPVDVVIPNTKWSSENSEANVNIIPRFSTEIFNGVHYTKTTVAGNNPLQYHTVYIDLTNPDLYFLVTPPRSKSDLELYSMKTTGFVRKYNLSLAINGDGWTPWDPQTGVPRIGDDVDITSYAMSNGEEYSIGIQDYTIYISEDNSVSIGEPLAHSYNAITGLGTLLKDGGIHSYANDGSKHPRTAIGLDKTGTIMIWVVIDGRQSFSEGVSLYETANIMLDAGSYDAVNMDGGGTSTMAMSTNLRPMIINNPCNWITPPFFERSGGNHLGIGLKD